MHRIFPLLLFLTVIAGLFFNKPTRDPAVDSQITFKPELVVPKKLQSKKYATSSSILDDFDKAQLDKSFTGFTLYPEVGTESVLLINMNGNTVHSWQLDAARAHLLPDCSLLVVHGSKWGLKNEPWMSLRKTVRKYNWNGESVWEYTRNDRPFHHDVTVLDNGNLLSIQSTLVPATLKNPARFQKNEKVVFLSDELVEISLEGNEQWSWSFHEHMDMNSCGKYRCPKITDSIISGEKPFDWSHLNSAKEIPDNKWFRNGDTRFTPGNILIVARNWSTIFVIAKDSGNIVWQYQGDPKTGLQYGHEALMISDPLPGAGNILLFDNGVERRQSQILEIDPTSKEIVWSFSRGSSFFSAAAGSVQRLPNGNTLISEDLSGRVFEVTSLGEIIWAYEGQGIRSARATRYAPDHCANLQELALITEPEVQP